MNQASLVVKKDVVAILSFENVRKHLKEQTTLIWNLAWVGSGGVLAELCKGEPGRLLIADHCCLRPLCIVAFVLAFSQEHLARHEDLCRCNNDSVWAERSAGQFQFSRCRDKINRKKKSEKESNEAARSRRKERTCIFSSVTNRISHTFTKLQNVSN